MDTLGLETRKRLTLAATILGSSLAFIDATVVIVALPTIEEDLDLGLTGQQWVFLSYSLALASLYLVGGAIGDRYGLRRVFVWGAAGFADFCRGELTVRTATGAFPWLIVYGTV